MLEASSVGKSASAFPEQDLTRRDPEQYLDEVHDDRSLKSAQ
ncbi:hypothetical protein [Mesorhizobium sp.]|nr:hypothetical protein [Mesorhizobium sp.]